MVFYKKEGQFIRYSKDADINIIPIEEWVRQRDNFTKYWIEYDFNKSFFDNFRGLIAKVPFPNVFHIWLVEDSRWADTVRASKHIYLSQIVILDCENVLYSFFVKENSRNILNSVFVIWNNDNVYQSIGVFNSYNVFYSRYINNCSDIWFSSNLTWCRECIFCDWLENKSYCIENKQYTKEEYFKRKQEILKNKDKFEDWYKTKVNKIWANIGSSNVKGSFIINSFNIDNGKFLYNVANSKNVYFVWWTQGDEEVYSCITSWSPWMKNVYHSVLLWSSEHIYCSAHLTGSYEVYYSIFIDSCKYILWSIWLMNKEYCILNKQYTKEEWFNLTKKIFNQMDKEWILGKFFPGKITPYNFNDTLANVLADFDKEEVKRDGYMWRDDVIKADIPEWAEIVDIDSIDVCKYDEKILKKIFRDKKWNLWRVVPIEYKFLKKYDLPLPRIHWLDRIKAHFR